MEEIVVVHHRRRLRPRQFLDRQANEQTLERDKELSGRKKYWPMKGHFTLLITYELIIYLTNSIKSY